MKVGDANDIISERGDFMTHATTYIPFDEFSNNLTNVFERVIHEQTAIVVEKADGELVALTPVSSSLQRRSKTEADYKAFHAAAGGWKDVDIDILMKKVYKSRKLASRSPVIL